MTHTIKLPMRQQISGFWDSFPQTSLSLFLILLYLCAWFFCVVWRLFLSQEVFKDIEHIGLCPSLLFPCGLMGHAQETQHWLHKVPTQRANVEPWCENGSCVSNKGIVYFTLLLFRHYHLFIYYLILLPLWNKIRYNFPLSELYLSALSYLELLSTDAPVSVVKVLPYLRITVIFPS